MKKEIIKEIIFTIAENNRKSMINVIIKYSNEEYESKNDLIELAKKTDEQLRFVLKDLVDYLLNEEK